MQQSSFNVVLVDDDKDLLEVLKMNLMEEFRVEIFTDPEVALKFMESNQADAVVLDYHMPGKNGLDFFSKFKAHKNEPPVLLLTGDGDVNLKVGCLDSGVDDFLMKPISTPELSAHLRNRIRSFKKRNPAFVKMQNLEVNLAEPLVTLDGKQIALTPKEFQILSLLVTRPNTVIKKNEIVETLWPEVKVEENNVDTHISNLRKKLRGFKCEIKTIKCFGYMLRY